MSSAASVTTWIEQLRAGNRAAAQHLWDRYFRRLVDLARTRLRGVPRGAADEEDVALCAFDSFCRGLERGRFPLLDGRDDLWALLMVITARKAIDLRQREGRQKRGGGRVGGESVLDELLGDEDGARGISQKVGKEPTPEIAAQVAEQFRVLLALLPNEEVRSVALRKMEGYTHDEIAAAIGCAVVTVGRRVELIRSVWRDSATG